MSKDEETYLKLGREMVRMIHDVQRVAGNEPGYARREITFPGGKVYVFVANSERVADAFDLAASKRYDVADAVPPSTLN